jgi:two-component system chemotaxis response regulator CheY
MPAMALRLLVVDDNQVSRILIMEMVRESGHQVVAEAESLQGAMEAYRTHKPDVVTLDLSLADEDGRSILKALRREDPRAQVVVISGNAQPQMREQLAAAGASGFVSKPFTPDDLARALSRFSAKA